MPRLYMLLIGCSPAGRNIEQHDVFFGIGEHISDLIPDVISFWPEAKGKLHFDAWREVNLVNGFEVKVVENESVENTHQLFFINLGGYKKNEFEEFHYKMIVAAPDKGEAVKLSKQTAFFKHTGFKGANSHIDDKYGIDVDDIYAIKDILPSSMKNKFTISISQAATDIPEDEIHLGYFRIDNVEKWAPKL
ncbi:MAG: DUF1543 domain-containing protein [Flavitalea sp.]